MDVHLFIPCFIDVAAPQVAMATVTVLRRAGCTLHYDPEQTCCGQPLGNSGDRAGAARLVRRHLDRFKDAPAVVAPGASCVAFLRRHAEHLGMELSAEDRAVLARTYELSEFLVRVLGVTDLGAAFPHRVALHHGCHGLRDLGLGAMSERTDGAAAPAEVLLRQVRGLEVVPLVRRDECCGFGGSFCADFPDLSARMGTDKLAGATASGAEYLCSADQSCLGHLDGLARRSGGPTAIHLAEILACT